MAEETKSGCLSARTGPQWRRLLGAYTVFYTFLGCWMAALMAIYMSTTSDTCTWNNGDNFCLGESKFHNLIDAAVTVPRAFRSLNAECKPNNCTVAGRVRVNNDWKLRELDLESLIVIRCNLVADDNVLAGLGYSANCDVPTDVRTNIEQGGGDFIGHDCRVIGAHNLTYSLSGGAKQPFVTEYEIVGDPNVLSPTPPGNTLTVTSSCKIDFELSNIKRDFGREGEDTAVTLSFENE